MAPKPTGDKKKNINNISPPGLRPRKLSQPSTSTPVPTNTRKRKSSLSREQGNSAKKTTEQQTSTMIRSPATTNKNAKGGFRLEPATLKVGVAPASAPEVANPALEAAPTDEVGLDTDNEYIDGSASSLLGDTATSTNLNVNEPDVLDPGCGGGEDKDEDPFKKLHNMMALNFSTLSGQLGLLQSNVVGISETVENLKSEVGGMNNRLTNVTAQAVSNKCGIASINKKLSEMRETNAEEIGRQVSAAVAKELGKADFAATISNEVAEKMDKMDKELDRMRAVNAVQNLSSANNQSRRTQMGARGTTKDNTTDESRQYWAARKRIRCAPIPPGENNNDLLRNTDAFFQQHLAIPSGEINPDSIIQVRRVPGKKKGRNLQEAVITFDSIQTRDCVASYASNLAGYNGDPALRPALRLEVPDHLCGVFRVLERYAHILKNQNPCFFKRSIKYDDVNLTLVLDYCTSQGGEWHRATYEEAAEMSRGRARSVRSSTSSAHGSQDNNPPTNENDADMNQD